MAKKELIVKCVDNCSCLSVDKWDDETEYVITTYKSYSQKDWRDRIIDIWTILVGGDVVDAEIILKEEEFTKLKNFK